MRRKQRITLLSISIVIMMVSSYIIYKQRYLPQVEQIRLENSAFYLIGQWINNAYDDLPRLQFSTLHTVQVRSESVAQSYPSLDTLSPDALLERWLNYQQVWRDYLMEALGITQEMRSAPHNIQHMNTREINFRGTSYTIEIVAWDAFTAMRVPINIYRPTQPREARLPVVLSPLGCSESLTAHNDATSVQRRAANLALRGFLVVVMNGFCDNGIIATIPGNHYAYRTYGDVTGTGQQITTYEVLMWMRILDYLETRPDVAMDRVGVTGYSNGGGISDLLSLLDERIRASGIVATSLGPLLRQPEQDSSTLVESPWYPAALSDLPDHYVYTPGRQRLYPPADQTAIAQAQALLPLEIVPVMLTDPQRDHLRVVGIADSGTSVDRHRLWFRYLTDGAHLAGLDPSNQELVTVQGGHDYNAERRRIVTDWLAQMLAAQEVIPPPDGDYEYETPILERSVLEPAPEGFGTITIRQLFADEALRMVEARRETHPFPADDPAEARAVLAELLRLPQDIVPEIPSIQFRQQGFNLETHAINLELMLVALPYPVPFYAAATWITPQPDSGQNIENIIIYVMDGDAVLPEETTLTTWLESGRVVIILHPPGYGPLTWPQTSRGEHAQQAPDYGYTLAGMGVSAMMQTVSLAENLFPGARISLYADGVEASILAMFAAALDDHISATNVYNSVHSFQDFLTAPTLPIMPPTLLVPGILSVVDVDDLQHLAGERRITIHSTSDLAMFYPDF